MKKIGELLTQDGLINDEQLQAALKEQKEKKNGRLGSLLVRQGVLDVKTLTPVLEKQLGIRGVALEQYELNPNLLKLVPRDVAKRYQVIPLDSYGTTLTLAMVDPTNIHAIDDIKFLTGYNIEPVISPEISVTRAIERAYPGGDDEEETGVDVVEEDFVSPLDEMDADDIHLAPVTGEDDSTDMESASTATKVQTAKNPTGEMAQKQDEQTSVARPGHDVDGASKAPVIKLVNTIIADAVKRGASDIHIEPYEKIFRVRYRIDGMLYEVLKPKMEMKNPITSRIKIMSNLDIAERRLPQDGRIKVKMKDKDIDLRVSTLPTLFGEKIVMRILDKSALSLDLGMLGFEKEDEDKFIKAIEAPYGMCLVTGPTGSGKTTTLYSALSTINKIETNIMTAEDPVEYNLKGINQVHMRSEIGLTFAAALRAFLRQDPDVVMVGEIRDYETAEIAVKAALTGHLVLSTVHTNDAPSTVNRLINMGIEPFLVSSSVILILAQRLVRKVCKECGSEEKLSEDHVRRLGLTPEQVQSWIFRRGKGCPVCSNTGYKGRIAIYEVMPVSESIKKLIVERAPTAIIKEKARELGMNTLRDSAMIKLSQGGTTPEEVLRVTFQEEE